ncbi:MAG: acyltransferase family protein [Candidatus Nanopelagicales bacterium]
MVSLAEQGTATRTRTTPNHRPDIQGIRAMVILVGVAYHAGWPIPGGYAGIDMFFVISGFVITGLLDRELLRRDSISLGTFYARRVARLAPALALMITVVALLSTLVESPLGSQQVTAATGLGAVFLVANVVVLHVTGSYFSPAAETNPLLATWSLSAEEQVYLIVPAAIALTWWLWRRRGRRHRRRAVALTLAAISTASLALSVWLSYSTTPIGPIAEPRDFSYFSSLTRIWEFGAGALLALAIDRLARLPRRGAAPLAWIAVVVSAVVAITFSADTPYPGWLALFPVMACIFLIVAGSVASNPVSRTLSRPSLVWLGDRSYSWYLWHFPLIVLARFLWPGSLWATSLAGAVSLLPAALSFRFVENPLRFGPRLRGRGILPVAAVCVAVPAAACAALWAGASAQWWSPTLQSVQAQVGPPHVDVTRGCDTSVRGADPGSCLWNADAAGTPVYLVGDSQAGQFSEGVIAGTQATGRPLRIWTHSGCPVTTVAVVVSGVTQTDCTDHTEATLRWLQGEPEGIVLLATGDYFAYGQPGYSQGPDIAGTDPADTFATGVAGIVRRLTAMGHQVVVIRTPAHFYPTRDRTGAWQAWRPAECPAVRMLVDTGNCGTTQGDDIAAVQERIWDRTAPAVTAAGASTLDLTSALCSGGCRTNRGDQWLYRDGGHLTVRAARQLGPVFAEVLSGPEPRPLAAARPRP